MRLGVNIDHVATLRQARGGAYPCVERAAEVALNAGADQITIHLREDRRHIQDLDLPAVKKITEKYRRLLNLELGCSPLVLAQGLDVAPDWLCLVPESRQELTTEGGLNLLDAVVRTRVENTMKEFRRHSLNTKISLFLNHDLKILQIARELGCEAVEIHTGEYAHDFVGHPGKVADHLRDFVAAQSFLNRHGIGAHAGHGLTDESLLGLLKEVKFVEYNIGHWIISEAIFSSLENVVTKLRRLIDENC